MSRNTFKHSTFVLVFAWFSICLAPDGAAADPADPHSSGPVAGGVGAAVASSRAPIVIAHRGASGLRPEHTLGAYEMALAQGADFIELDLVATLDGRLIARHENALAMVALDASGRIERDADGRPVLMEATTDVAERQEFAERLTVKQVDGRLVGGWFSEDFTFAEIRTLKARERLPDLRPQNRLHDDQEQLPTLAEAVALVRGWTAGCGDPAGLYIEIKHPTYFLEEGRRLSGERIGLDLAELVLAELVSLGFTDPERVFIQSFEVAPLLALNDRMQAQGLNLPLVQLFGDVHNSRYRAAPRDLVYYAKNGDLARYGELNGIVPGGLRPDLTYADLATPAVLAYMAQRYAAGIGPPRSNVLQVERVAGAGPAVFTGELEPLLAYAHGAGLAVHPYTLRTEAPFLFRYQGAPLLVAAEARILLEAGVQGFFIDQPAEGRLAVDRYRGLLAPALEAREPL